MGHPTPYWYGYVGGRGIVGWGVCGQTQVSVFEMYSYEDIN